MSTTKVKEIMQKIAVITGASKGIGLETAKYFFSKGYAVYDLSRSGGDTAWSTHVYCDVADASSVAEATAQVLNQTNRIDLLVCNAGYGISGAVEFTAVEEAKKQFDVKKRQP